jgi:hypothetical protein
MASARRSVSGVPETESVAPSGREGDPEGGERAPAALAIGLLLICLYAAFDHGAVGPAGEERLQLAISVIAAVAWVTWLWTGRLRVDAPRTVWGAVALLGAFALWSGVTLAWSVAPDQTWAECNRAIGYALALGLAVVLGASDRRAGAMIAHGFLAVSAAVTVYALAQKLLPGLHVAGIVNLDTTGPLPRLQEPLGYWNALALLIAMGAPLAFSLAVQRHRPVRIRIGALVLFVLMLETIAFTYSRGGVLALIAGLATLICLGGAGLRCLAWLGAACLAAAPPVVVGLLSHPLTAASVRLGTREDAGLELAALLAACLVLLALAARRLIGIERHMRISERGARRIGRALGGTLAAVAVVAVIVVALSGRGLGGTVSHAWSSFTTTRATSVADPARLLSADSENRWVWWKEAAGAFSDRPLGGWGAGSFGVVHLLYRRDTLSVQQPHSVPLQFLAEVGLIGAGLALLAVILILRSATAAVGRRRTAGGRLLAAGLLAGGIAYLVHELYDWDWDIPGVTLPALVLLGTLAGSIRRTRGASEVPMLRGRAAVRGAVLVGGVVCVVAFAVSAVVPRLAARRASDALLFASSGQTADLRSALDEALSVSRLDPLSDAGLRTASTIDVHLRRPDAARRLLLEALRRTPMDGQAWQQLAYEDLALGADAEGLAAAERARELDPQSKSAIALVEGSLLATEPPDDSATASRTP